MKRIFVLSSLVLEYSVRLSDPILTGRGSLISKNNLLLGTSEISQLIDEKGNPVVDTA